jgi:amino acid transporter
MMVAELSSMMPEEGGYYVWVRNALGPFWGLQEACWTLGYSVILMAIFPVMFVNYLAHLVPVLSVGADGPSWPTLFVRWLAALAVILSALLANWHGARSVGSYSQLSVAMILGAFGMLACAGLAREGAMSAALSVIRSDLATGHGSTVLLGLSIVIFNYSGWDGASTVAGEVLHADHSYPRALAAALLATVLVYLLPVLAGVAATTHPAVWSAEAGWPEIGTLVAGRGMGMVLAGAALVSSWSLFNSNLLCLSRLPYVLACDGWLPRGLSRVSRETGVPTVALVWCGAFSAVFAAASFGNLVVMFVLLYAAAMALEFLALAVLRLRRPEAARAFRVPGGWPGVAYVCLTPLLVAGVVLAVSLREQESYALQLFVVATLIASGAGLYRLRRRSALEPSRDSRGSLT